MKNIGGIKIIMIAALALIILAGTGAAVSLSNSGGGTWKYQREISIKENSGTTLTDYQVLIEIKGADFPLEAKSDGSDVRFTNSNGNELNYWIESWDYAGKSAKVWVKETSILSGSTTVIRMYYGNPSAISMSNGDTVFEFFDDFSGNSVDTSKWNAIYYGSGSVTVSNGKIKIDGAELLARNYLFTNGIIESKARSTIGFETSIIARGVYRDRITYDDSYMLHSSTYGGWEFAINFHHVPKANSGVTLNPNIDYYYKFILNGNAMSGYRYKDEILDTSTSWIDSTYSSGTVGLRAYGNNIGERVSYYDWFRVRKYASSEPTVTLAPPKSSSLTITKSASPYSLRQFQESTIKVLIENSGTSEVKAIEIMDSIHPSFDLTGGDFPNPKKFDSIRAGESRELQYTIKSKESGAFTLDPATVTYADSEGNIQEVKSEPVSIKVVPSSDGGSSGSNTGQNSKSASVSLHGEKTDVVMGEDILLRLSAVNLITKPRMHVQVIIIPPSGMSVTSSEFSKSAAGQFTANYQLEPGDGKDIEVRIRSNQIGDFNVNGRIIYYFGEEKEKAEDQTLNLPIKVRKEIASTQEPVGKSTPGFEGVFGISGLLFVLVLIKRSSSLK